ncbi:N-6 DNA methylase [Nocardia sp. NPDC059764]|uniref:N-6 DNA methylase n=1 Tax=Nocardia sp. NPDC059764 TaxID=3346939 RepID=UPI003662F18D
MPESGAATAALWDAASGLRDEGFRLEQVRILTLVLIYSRARGNSRADSESADEDFWAAAIEYARDQVPELRDENIPAIGPRQMPAARKLLEAVDRLMSTETAGDAFLTTLDVLTPDRRSSEFFTPRGVTDLLVSCLDPAESGQVFDPSCGTGEFLAAVAAHMANPTTPKPLPRFIGTAPTTSSVAIARMNLAVHGADGSGVQADWPESEWPTGQATFVLTNPPFNMRSTTDDSRSWRYGVPPRYNANYAWLQQAVEALTSTGRAAVIMPNSTLTSSAEESIRRNMVEDGCVEALISLPSKLFRHTGIPVCVWLLRAPSESSDVLFIDASQNGTNIDRTLRTLAPRDIERIGTIVKTWRAERRIEGEPNAISVDISTIREHQYRLTPAVYLRASLGARDPKSTLTVLRRTAARLTTDQQAGRRADSTVDMILSALITSTGRHPEWPMTVLGDICSITPGASIEVDPDGTTPVVKPKDLARGRVTPPSDHTNPQEAERRSTYRIAVGDLLCSRTGTVGRSAVVTADQDGWLFSTGLIRLRPCVEGIDPLYLHSYLAGAEAQEWIRDRAEGTAIMSINAKTLKQLPVRLPPLPEQAAIGRAASSFDRQLEAHDRIRATMFTAREAAMNLLLSGHVAATEVDSTG